MRYIGLICRIIAKWLKEDLLGYKDDRQLNEVRNRDRFVRVDQIKQMLY